MNSARSVNLSSKCSNIQGYCILTLMKNYILILSNYMKAEKYICHKYAA